MTLDYVAELLDTVDAAGRELLPASPESTARRPPHGGWSAKEIMGHLIDSAAHNHQRFVRARWQDHLVFDGYTQDDWVAAQRYQEAPWIDLVQLWQQYNRHLARVMSSIPDPVRLRRHARHNLHQVAWRAIPASEPATLDYFMRDYVGHLQHHLRQIRALLAEER